MTTKTTILSAIPSNGQELCFREVSRRTGYCPRIVGYWCGVLEAERMVRIREKHPYKYVTRTTTRCFNQVSDSVDEIKELGRKKVTASAIIAQTKKRLKCAQLTTRQVANELSRKGEAMGLRKIGINSNRIMEWEVL